MRNLKTWVSVLLLLGLLIVPKPAYAGTNTLEICTSEYNVNPVVSHNFTYYGPYGQFGLHVDSGNNLACHFIGSESSLNAGTYGVSEVIESDWNAQINCFKVGSSATWSVSDMAQSATITFTGSSTYVQCEYQNYPD